MRDRVVLWVLIGGAFLALLAWRALGPWPGLLLVLAAVLVASVAYRIEAPRIDLHGEPVRLDVEELAEQRSEAVDQ